MKRIILTFLEQILLTSCESNIDGNLIEPEAEGVEVFGYQFFQKKKFKFILNELGNDIRSTL